LRRSEARRIIDVAEGERGHHADARHGHPPPRCFVRLGEPADAIVQRHLLLSDLRVHDEQSIDDRSQRMAVVKETKHMGAKRTPNRAWEEQADLLQHATDLVLEVTADTNQACPRHQCKVC
jgi:hypothetical protein